MTTPSGKAVMTGTLADDVSPLLDALADTPAFGWEKALGHPAELSWWSGHARNGLRVL